MANSTCCAIVRELSDSSRERILTAVLTNLDTLSSSHRSALQGFLERLPAAASGAPREVPVNELIPVALQDFARSEGFAEAVLHAWGDLNPTWRGAARDVVAPQPDPVEHAGFELVPDDSPAEEPAPAAAAPPDVPVAIVALKARFAEAAATLRRCADDLDRGAPPDEAVCRELPELRAAFEALAARAAGSNPAPDLPALATWWERDERRRRVEEMRPLLERVLRLRARGVGGDVLAPLRAGAECALAAGDIDESLLPTSQALHAIDALFELCDGVMDPARCQELHGSVAAAFGEALAWAALRGRIDVAPPDPA